jgi:hypothetical protein
LVHEWRKRKRILRAFAHQAIHSGVTETGGMSGHRTDCRLAGPTPQLWKLHAYKFNASRRHKIPKGIPGDLLVDSTGLKIYGEGEWLDRKHGIRARRRWRKLHLGVDADTHEIVPVN